MMIKKILRIFGGNVGVKNAENSPARVVPDEILGEISLREMVRKSFTGKYVFHGSPAKLEPGYDILRPGFYKHSECRVYAGAIDIALRFALVRAWGVDQYGGTDFYVFCTRRHRLVIYDSRNIGMDWYKQNISNGAYVYAIPADGVVLDRLSRSEQALPVVARALVNQEELAKAGFWFACEQNISTERWWGIENNDEVIRRVVFPAYPYFYKRQR